MVTPADPVRTTVGFVPQTSGGGRSPTFSAFRSISTPISGVTFLNPTVAFRPPDAGYLWAPNGPVTVQNAGTYKVLARASLVMSANPGVTRVAVGIYVNGSLVGGTSMTADLDLALNNQATGLSTFADLDLAAGDVVQVGATVVTGPGIPTAIGQTPALSITRV